eukprot:GHUV01001013.1.p1 GENE.GHUV01001013.1~~GHUV01001013.1.p1  ORF type:complete len:557 (+),score=197.92 GHUV01001013.1:301-1971(+)
MEGLSTSRSHLFPDTSAYSMQNLGANQQFASNLAALLLQKHGLAAADALLGASSAATSRSGSPYTGGQDANNATGVLLEAGIMQLPPSAKPVPASTTPSSAGHHKLQPQHLQQFVAGGHSCGGDSQCSHNTSHLDAAVATPPRAVNLFMPAPRPASPSPPTQQAAGASHTAAPAAVTLQQANVTASAVAPLPRPHVPAATAGSTKSWLYQLVTCPYLFKPCPQCAPTHSGREVLITYFDPDEPSVGYCTYCPQRASKPRLLQIRRSTYHEVVKAADISRLADVSGIQHYVINGAKVLFLRPRPQPRPPKGVVAPARCSVDGRQLMDAHSSYCSLRCKLEVEDKAFADNYPSAVEEMEAAAAAGDGGDSSAMGLAGTYHRQGGHEGRRVVVPNNKRAASAAPAGEQHQDEGSSEEGEAGDHKRAKRQRNLPSKFANTVLGGSANYQSAGAAPPSRSHQQQHGPQHRPQHYHSNKATQQQAVQYKQELAVAEEQLLGGHLGLAALSGAAQQQMTPVKSLAEQQPASPCASEDSARSSTCNQRWHHKRKVMQPCRAPLE